MGTKAAAAPPEGANIHGIGPDTDNGPNPDYRPPIHDEHGPAIPAQGGARDDGADMFAEGVASAAASDPSLQPQPASDPLAYFRSIDPAASELWNQAGTARSGVERFACYMVKVARARRFVIVATYQGGGWQAFAEAGDVNGGDLRTALGMLYA